MNPLIAFFQSIPFFHSLTFGIAAMVLVGASWCIVGLVMGDAPKKNIDTGAIQFYGALFSAVCSIVVLLATVSMPDCSAKVLFLTCGAYFLYGVLNFIMLQIMAYAMQCGPNGLIWSIIQSSPMIFPFIGAILFFGEELTLLRGVSITLLLLAMGGFGLAQDNSTANKKSGHWKLASFICVLLCAVGGNLSVAPSYFPEARVVSSILRTLMFAGGVLLPSAVYLLVKKIREKDAAPKREWKNPLLWKYVLLIQIFNLFFSYALQYPGMDAMAAHGYGGVCCSIMIGSCIVAFTVVSHFWLKEKITALQGISLLVCITGLVMLCF